VRQPTAPTLPLKLRGYGTSRWQLCCNRILTIPEAFDKAVSAARYRRYDTKLLRVRAAEDGP